MTGEQAGRLRVAAAAVPVVLVNGVAFAGQLAFLRARLPWPLPGQVTVALALESVAIYLAAMAHLAALANDSALRLRLAAYGWALVIGAMNYSHYAGPGWRPTFAALATGLCSVASPWLWATYTRRVSRDRLLAAGLVEPHALRLGGTRWAWHPLRSARVMYLGTWEGITDPAEALDAARTRAAGRGENRQPSSVLSTVPADVIEAAKASLAATTAAGNALSQNQLMERFRLTRAQAVKVRQEMTAISHGQAGAKALARATKHEEKERS